MLPLVLAPQRCGVPGAVACITAFMALQAFAYAGFHAYVQARCSFMLTEFSCPSLLRA
jgi:hypothetical protein